MTLTLYANAWTPRPIAQDEFAAWEPFVTELEALTCREAPGDDKRALPAWSPHVLVEGADRDLSAVVSVSALVIDVDVITDDQLDAALDRADAAGWAAFVYASPSDPNPDDTRRVRIVSPVSRHMTPAECRVCRVAFADSLGLVPGQGVEACLDASRMFFAGRVRGAPERDSWQVDGEAVDVDRLLARPVSGAWPDPSASVSVTNECSGAWATGTERVEDMIQLLAPEWPPAGVQANRRELVRALGGYLARQGWSDQAVHECVLGLPSDTPAERAALAVETARQARTGATTAGYATLETRLGEPVARAVEHASASAAFEAWLAERAARPRVATPIADMSRVSAIGVAITPDAPRPPLAFDLDQKGQPKPTLTNVTRFLAWLWPEDRGLALEESLGRVVLSNVSTLDGVAPGEWVDVHTTALRRECEAVGMSVSKELADQAVDWHAHAHAYNALTEAALMAAGAWDGVARVDASIATYWKGADTDAHREAARVFWLSLAARALWPGCKVDTCPVFCDPTQGTRKSSALRVIAGGPERFTDSPLPESPERAAHAMRGKWLIELGEGVIMKRRDAQMMRALLSAQDDHYQAPYARRPVTVPRTVVFAMTTNDPTWAPSDVDERRYLPVTLTGSEIDLAALRRDRVQLIGEAVARVLGNAELEDGPPEDEAACAARDSEPWWPQAVDVLRTARAAHAPDRHPWCDAIEEWIARRGGRDSIESAALWAIDGPIPVDVGQRSPALSRTIGACMRALGYVPAVVGTGTVRARGWVKAS